MTYREMQVCHGDGNNLQPNWQMAGHMVSVYTYVPGTHAVLMFAHHIHNFVVTCFDACLTSVT